MRRELAPLAVFLVALAVRAWAAAQLDFPPTENSASYVGVARNLLEGRGLVSDAMWSYATPPLVLPKPAFEIWMPLATFLAAIPMTVLGHTLAAAQVSSVLLGAAIAPLAWLVARDAARRHGLDDRRVAAVALTAGIATAICGPLVTASIAPDSTTPFTLIVLLGCLVVPGALRASLRHAIALGALLALAYLTRQEAIWLAAAFVLLLVGAARRRPAPPRRALLGALAATVATGAAVTAPWWLRNLSVFGTPMPGQATENAWLTRNEQIFAYVDRPDLAGFLAQGPATIFGNIGAAFGINALDAVLIPAAPLTLIGLVAVLVLRRSPALRSATPLTVLLLSGGLTYIATSVMFPIATRWGTFMHAAGPLLVGLIVAAVLGLDAGVARLGRTRGWAKPNVLLPLLLVVGTSVPLTFLQVRVFAGQTAATRDAIGALIADLARQPELADPRTPIVTDHPMFVAEAARRPTLALPDEAPLDVWRLARDFDAPLVVILDGRGRYPDAFAAQGSDPAGTTCFRERPATPPAVPGERHHRIFVVLPACGVR